MNDYAGEDWSERNFSPVEDEQESYLSVSSDSDNQVDSDADGIEVFSEVENSVFDDEISSRMSGMEHQAGASNGEITQSNKYTTAASVSAELVHQIEVVSLSVCLFLGFFQLCYKEPE